MDDKTTFDLGDTDACIVFHGDGSMEVLAPKAEGEAAGNTRLAVSMVIALFSNNDAARAIVENLQKMIAGSRPEQIH